MYVFQIPTAKTLFILSTNLNNDFAIFIGQSQKIFSSGQTTEPGTKKNVFNKLTINNKKCLSIGAPTNH